MSRLMQRKLTAVRAEWQWSSRNSLRVWKMEIETLSLTKTHSSPSEMQSLENGRSASLTCRRTFLSEPGMLLKFRVNQLFVNGTFPPPPLTYPVISAMFNVHCCLILSWQLTANIRLWILVLFSWSLVLSLCSLSFSGHWRSKYCVSDAVIGVGNINKNDR